MSTLESPTPTPQLYSYTWTVGGGYGLVADKEIEIFGSAFHGKVAGRTGAACEERGLVRDGGAARAGTAASTRRTFRGYGGRKDEGGRVIAGETYKRAPKEQPVSICGEIEDTLRADREQPGGRGGRQAKEERDVILPSLENPVPL